MSDLTSIKILFSGLVLTYVTVQSKQHLLHRNYGFHVGLLPSRFVIDYILLNRLKTRQTALHSLHVMARHLVFHTAMQA
jgi:hypothetical protein